METPPPDHTVPPALPERRCPRCGSTLAPDQEWCLACGAAAGTEVVEARGWRVPLYLGGGLAALAVIGVILAIIALASRKEEVARNPNATPTPSPQATAPPAATATPLATLTPAPTTDPNATPTQDPTNPDATPEPTTSPEPSPTEDPGTTDQGGTGTTVGDFPGWTIGDGYTVIIESSRSQSGAERVARRARDAGETVGILNSDEFTSLNGGYWVVFSGEYTTKSEAEDALDGLKSKYSDAYVRKITPAN